MEIWRGNCKATDAFRHVFLEASTELFTVTTIDGEQFWPDHIPYGRLICPSFWDYPDTPIEGNPEICPRVDPTKTEFNDHHKLTLFILYFLLAGTIEERLRQEAEKKNEFTLRTTYLTSKRGVRYETSPSSCRRDNGMAVTNSPWCELFYIASK